MKLKLFFIFVCLILVILQANAEIKEHFDIFYQNYIELHQVSIEDRDVLNLMNQISNEKFKAIEKCLIQAKNKQERLYFINLINEEYKELLENLNFELSYVPHCPIRQKCHKKFKKAHKKYMRQIENCYS